MADVCPLCSTAPSAKAQQHAQPGQHQQIGRRLGHGGPLDGVLEEARQIIVVQAQGTERGGELQRPACAVLPSDHAGAACSAGA